MRMFCVRSYTYVVRPPMLFRIASTTLLLLATNVFAASPQDFGAAAAESAKKAKTTVGGAYGVKFMRSIANSVAPAIGACGGGFATGSKYDAVFIVSASGRVERVVQGRTNPYGECFSSHLRLPASVAKPPSSHWPVHICVVQNRPKEAPNSYGCFGLSRGVSGFGCGGGFCFR